MDRKADVIGLNSLLAAHFAPLALDELVVTRRDFPHWMRPDLQRGLEALFSRLVDSRFYGARVRDEDLAFRLSNLAEAGDGIVAGPAEYQDVDIGEAQPVRCLTRGPRSAFRAKPSGDSRSNATRAGCVSPTASQRKRPQGSDGPARPSSRR